MNSDYTPKVKICGLRDTENALVAAHAGADFLGLNFVEGVRRQLQPIEGQMIVRGFRIRGFQRKQKGPKLVGLFRNQPVDFVNDVARHVDLDYVQLCGDEDEAYIRKMWKPVFRQVRVKDGSSPGMLAAEVGPHLAARRIVLLDHYDEKAPGGTGVTFDWAAAEGVASNEGVLLAGGLTPDNVRSAIGRLRPWGVDVASGVETDGVMDPEKIKAFIAAAKGGGAPVS
jgi:phosphoribosylanthranilate isomerase